VLAGRGPLRLRGLRRSAPFWASPYDECSPFVRGIADETFTHLICRRLPRAADRLQMDEGMPEIIDAKGWLWRAIDRCGLPLDEAVQKAPRHAGHQVLASPIIKGAATFGSARVRFPRNGI
jgi:hypothetical protein